MASKYNLAFDSDLGRRLGLHSYLANVSYAFSQRIRC